MKKHSEGYVMIYVLVVMVLLALVATGVLSVSLNNLKAQKAAGDRMQELYETEGVVERITAELDGNSGELILPESQKLTGLDPGTVAALAKVTCIAAVMKMTEERIEVLPELPDLAGKTISVNMVLDDGKNEEETITAHMVLSGMGALSSYECTLPYHVEVQSDSGATAIVMELELRLAVDPKSSTTPPQEGETEQTDWLDGASVKVEKLRYLSYEIKTGVAA